MSENILATSYTTIPEAIKTANQIRRTSLLVQDESAAWKLLIINNRFKIAEDLQNISLSDAETYININDSQGNILRNKIQLNSNNLGLFTRLVANFSGQDTLPELADISRRFKSLISAVKKDESSEPVIEEKEDKSGVYEIKPLEYFCHFKKFFPQKVLLQQKVDSEAYTSFMLQITFNTKSGVDTIAPLLRKRNIPVQTFYQAISQGKAVQIVVQLNDKILEKMKYIMFNTDDLEKIMSMKNPLGKNIFTDLSNYVLADIKLI